MDNERQDQQKSSVDRANDFINKTKGAYKQINQTRKVITRSVQVLRTFATPGLGSIIVIILSSLIFATFLLTMIGGGTATGTENQTTATPSATLEPGLSPVISQPPIPPSSNSVAGWAKTISSTISPLHCYLKKYNGYFDVYNQRKTNVCNSSNICAAQRNGACSQLSGYLCTNLVIDSYRLAGLRAPSNTWVPTMQKNWEAKTGGKVYNYGDTCHDGTTISKENLIRSLNPGDVIFMYTSGCNEHHVVIVNSVHISNPTTGSGYISIYQSNCADKSNCTSDNVGFGGTNAWAIGRYFGSFTKFAFGFAPR